MRIVSLHRHLCFSLISRPMHALPDPALTSPNHRTSSSAAAATRHAASIAAAANTAPYTIQMAHVVEPHDTFSSRMSTQSSSRASTPNTVTGVHSTSGGRATSHAHMEAVPAIAVATVSTRVSPVKANGLSRDRRPLSPSAPSAAAALPASTLDSVIREAQEVADQVTIPKLNRSYDLPAGWEMVERNSAKCKYKTYISPDGKKRFRSLAGVRRWEPYRDHTCSLACAQSAHLACVRFATYRYLQQQQQQLRSQTLERKVR